MLLETDEYDSIDFWNSVVNDNQNDNYRYFCVAQNIQELKQNIKNQDNLMFIEIGPGESLASFIAQTILFSQENPKKPKIFSSLRKKSNDIHDIKFMLSTLGKIWG